MTADLAPDTLVIVGGTLCRVARSQRFGTAHGYAITRPPEDPGEGYNTNFAPDWCVQPAVIGVNVCPRRLGEHWCGLVHIRHPEWLAVATDAAGEVFDLQLLADDPGTGKTIVEVSR